MTWDVIDEDGIGSMVTGWKEWYGKGRVEMGRVG